MQRGDLDAATAAAHMINDANASPDPAVTRASLEAHADVALLIGDLDVAATLFTQAHTLAYDAGDLLQAVWDLGSASLAIAYRGDTQRAYDLAAEVSAVAEQCGSPSARAFAHFVIGEILATVEPEAAEPQLLEAIQLAETADSRFVVGLAEVALAAVKIRQQDVAAALAYCEEAINEWHRAGAWTPLWVSLRTVLDLLHASRGTPGSECPLRRNRSHPRRRPAIRRRRHQAPRRPRTAPSGARRRSIRTARTTGQHNDRRRRRGTRPRCAQPNGVPVHRALTGAVAPQI